MKLRKLVAPLVTLAVLGAAGYATYVTREGWMPYVFPTATDEQPEGDHDHDHDHESLDRVTFSEQAQRNLQLDVGTLTPREYWRTILIPGVVVDRPGESDRGIPSRVAGIVADIRARPGDTVRSGDPLFTLQLVSEFLQTTQTELAKGATDLGFAIVERDRIARLVEAGTLSASELTKQQTQVDRLTTHVNGHRRQLQLFGFTPEQVARAEKGDVITEVVVAVPGRPAALTALSGVPAIGDEPAIFEVKELRLSPGDQVQPGQTLCVLADHRRLFVEGWAFKSEAKALAVAAEQRVPIRAEFADEGPGDWSPVEPLVIHHFASQVDPVSRTFPFYLALENQVMPFVRDGKTYLSWRFRVGQRVRLRVPIEKLTTLGRDGKTEVLPFVLPAGALVREGPEAFVFVQAGDVFLRRPVNVLYEDRTEVVIAADGSITRADLVVKNQAAAINRALKMAAAGGGHGHDHDH
jgi:membrane fusion protein, heavy metal efflux system